MISSKSINNISQINLFNALSDEVRLRLIRLLSREELNVNELGQILNIPQPTVSRHLSILKLNGLVNDRKDGVRSYYVINSIFNFEGGEEIEGIKFYIEHLGKSEHPDIERMNQCISNRPNLAIEQANELADKWEDISQNLYNYAASMMTLTEASGASNSIVDLGTGTGSLIPYLSLMAPHIYAIDQSPAMLNKARSRCQNINNVTFMQVPIEKLDGQLPESNRIILHFVMHQIPQPCELLSHISQFLAPHGKLIIADALSHHNEAYKKRFASQWYGFSKEQIIAWAKKSGLKILHWHEFPQNSETMPCFVTSLVKDI